MQIVRMKELKKKASCGLVRERLKCAGWSMARVVMQKVRMMKMARLRRKMMAPIVRRPQE
jgi:hypothetical protein